MIAVLPGSEHSEPAKIINNERCYECGGHGESDERHGTHFVDQRKTSVRLQCSDQTANYSPPASSPWHRANNLGPSLAGWRYAGG